MNRPGLRLTMCAIGLSIPALAADPEIELLKRMLADQQRQIDELRRELAAVKQPAPQSPASARTSEQEEPSLQFRLGGALLTPVAHMDLTSVTRSTNAGSGIGTNFGSIPFGNTSAGNLSESRLSPQNSRVGLRIDTARNGTQLLGYLEADFLGQLGNPPNGAIAVSSNSYPLRMRLYWVDLRKGKLEFLAGQSWSMMTPNRRGISPLPDDVFDTRNIDADYQVGLVWGRVPGVRLVYHASATTTLGVSFENSEPYVGGANGGGVITPPAALAGLLGAQINNGASVIGGSALHPDVIGKIAFDPGPRLHVELAGVEITNRIVHPVTLRPFRKAGGGGSLNINVAVLPKLRLVTNNFWSAGGGRYLFGQAPDFILRASGDLSLVHSASTVTGFEAVLGRTELSGYYGGVYAQRNVAVDANGSTRIGYGFPGSNGGQNRAIQEITFGTNTTLWKDPRFGALNLMFQYSYLERNPWFGGIGEPRNAHLHMGFINLRYSLPGIAPPDTKQ